jgi:hypothetical protein
MSLTDDELNRNVKLIKSFIKTAREELIDLYDRLSAAETTNYSFYVIKKQIDPVSGNEIIDYLDSSHVNDPDVEIKTIDWNELQDILQNTIGFYINTISKLHRAVGSHDFRIHYGK